MSAVLRMERDGDVAVIIHHDPERMNALSLDFQSGLRALLAQVREDKSLRAIVLTAEGRHFCVGADLASIAGAPPGDTRSLGERTAAKMQELSNPLILDLRELPVPVVCAVNGGCAGAGVGVALAADVVIAARSAYFYLPFIPRLGIVPDLGTTWFLGRVAGRSRAQALTLLGDRLPAEEAARWGLVWSCVDDAALREQALAVARRLARLPAHAALETRRAYEAAATNDLAAQLAYETDRQRELIDKPSFAEGVRAFFEKREPVFRGRGEQGS